MGSESYITSYRAWNTGAIQNRVPLVLVEIRKGFLEGSRLDLKRWKEFGYMRVGEGKGNPRQRAQ